MKVWSDHGRDRSHGLRSLPGRKLVPILLVMLFLWGCGNAGNGDGENLPAGNGDQGGVTDSRGVSIEELESKEVASERATAKEEAADQTGKGNLLDEDEMKARLMTLLQGCAGEKETKAAIPANAGADPSMVGIYRFAGYNAFDQRVLERYYGLDYQEDFPSAGLKADGTGKLIQQGSSLDFSFGFDDNDTCVFFGTGGILPLRYKEGDLILRDQDGNEYLFRKEDGQVIR